MKRHMIVCVDIDEQEILSEVNMVYVETKPLRIYSIHMDFEYISNASLVGKT